ncbi:cysteine dioxygenase [Heterostelium album PN500]|uniref:Cysteine dioxygenase n=1 Tax=Heterostelium pallidum (strain ATCC 26659 / Pp 5 / PN500) TaxID=670386 RepID=D3B9I6_HETP5|nr:cysteine dioxygenase [Heterostelium album PN500]EFA81898.1 cysteine dioxygenase [Heterostelium album PN500]|eukprot:XP_020434015.1 cysteine dioxygenase [Heterostelium album PN500]
MISLENSTRSIHSHSHSQHNQGVHATVSKLADQQPDQSELCEKPFEQLVKQIRHEFTFSQPDGTFGNSQAIEDLLNRYINEGHKDWNEYAFFCPYGYSRNLVACGEQFELMVICWAKGQVSPIHNHEGQRCWMACAKGQLQETQFLFENTMSTHGEGKLLESQVTTIDEGSVGYITDEIALHVIQSLEPVSVSIHLYSKPIYECNIYCPTTGKITRKKLGYYTQYKEHSPNHNKPILCQQE